MWQVVEEGVALNKHDMFHLLQVMELSLFDWESIREHSDPFQGLIWCLYPVWQYFPHGVLGKGELVSHLPIALIL